MFYIKIYYILDIDECNGGASVCDQTRGGCLNVPGSYRCNCSDGYILGANNECKGEYFMAQYPEIQVQIGML